MNGGSSSDAELIETAEEHLKTGDFEGCRNSVLTSPHYHPTNLTATQILTVTDLLSSVNPTRPDYYSVLFLTRFTDNPSLIKSRFKTLASLLNPNTNPLSLSSHALSLLIQAHSVLSDPEKKLEYDKWLKLVLNFGDASRTGTRTGFWTMCPYCYYVYEYERVYAECCLRCQNEECRRGFTATEIRVPPPETVAGSGRYLCLGFSPVGFKGLASWSPFSTPFEQVEEVNEEISGDVDAIRAEKSGFKRRKSVGVCANKVMGKGVRVQDGGIFGCS